MVQPSAPTGRRPASADGSPSARAPLARVRRKRWFWLTAAFLVLVAAGAVVWFQPQKLLYDQSVDEALPTPAAEQSPHIGSGSPTDVTTGQPMELRGLFISREHKTQGDARLLRLSDGRVVIRFED